MQAIGVLITMLVIAGVSVYFYTHFSSPGGINNNMTANQVVDTATDTAIKADIQNIKSVLEAYRVEKGKYPETLNDLVEAKMLQTVPKNPKTHEPYAYSLNGDTYQLESSPK